MRVKPEARNCINKLRNELETKLADDLHTPTIINAALQKALTLVNTYLDKLKEGARSSNNNNNTSYLCP